MATPKMAPGLASALLQRQDTNSTIVAKSTPYNTYPTTITKQATTPLHPHGQLLHDPNYVTTDFDALRFNAAANTQLIRHHDQQPAVSNSLPRTSQQEDGSQQTSGLLISSPYNHLGHYLDISSSALPKPSRLFALALTALQPTVSTYATTAYTEALNLDAVLSLLRDLIHDEGQDGEAFTWKETAFYAVVFRSKLKEEIDNDYLYKLDFESHREACESGGLLKYWFGKTDGERRNLATCFWHTREDAYKGGLGPWHKKARAAGRELYESIVFTTHRFTVLDGAEGYRFEDWNT
ncbi:UPF0643 [Pyrenophora seminiperda CCB06]|uniref:UPF0643 n=1 Tax=Pyrenophora seminiperda CCB06 TaxID=1302712 RepID=A0A3M7M9M9_9PLEO|nr:UPF0643 [Pyrenophora seminiperda CCB06]